MRKKNESKVVVRIARPIWRGLKAEAARSDKRLTNLLDEKLKRYSSVQRGEGGRMS